MISNAALIKRVHYPVHFSSRKKLLWKKHQLFNTCRVTRRCSSGYTITCIVAAYIDKLVSIAVSRHQRQAPGSFHLLWNSEYLILILLSFYLLVMHAYVNNWATLLMSESYRQTRSFSSPINEQILKGINQLKYEQKVGVITNLRNITSFNQLTLLYYKWGYSCVWTDNKQGQESFPLLFLQLSNASCR